MWLKTLLGSPQGTATTGWTDHSGNWTLKEKAKGANEEGKKHSTCDAPNWRMTKHRAEENMTSAHSAKETDKWPLTEDETPANTANPSLRSRMNTLSTQRVTTSRRANEWRTIGSLRSKPRRKTQSRVHYKSETLPKVQNSHLKMRVSTKLRHDRERIPNTA